MNITAPAGVLLVDQSTTTEGPAPLATVHSTIPSTSGIPSYPLGQGSRPLRGETIGQSLGRAAQRHGDQEAIVDRVSNRRWTYAALHGEVERLAHGLLRLGVERGDRVGIWAPNCAEWTMVQYATAQIGAVLVTINRRIASTSWSTH